MSVRYGFVLGLALAGALAAVGHWSTSEQRLPGKAPLATETCTEALSCETGVMALLDPPGHVVYTTRAPVSAPPEPSVAADETPLPGAGRRVTNTTPEAADRPPGEVGQDP